MDDMKEIKILLERIANALESIAHNLGTYREASKNNDKFQKTQNHTKRTREIEFTNDFSEIEDFLNSKNIHIKNIREEDESDEILDKIAFFYG